MTLSDSEPQFQNHSIDQKRTNIRKRCIQFKPAVKLWPSAAILDFIELQIADPENSGLETNVEWIGCTV